MTTSPTLSEFKETVREAFGYLEREFAFHEVVPPASLLEGNPFVVWFVNATTLVQVEGVGWGFAAQVLLGPAAGRHEQRQADVPLWAIIKDRTPDLYEQSAMAPGQLGAIRHCARALRETASDVLRGDFGVFAFARAVVDAEAARQRLLENEETRDRILSAAVSAATDALRRRDYGSVVELLAPHIERLTPADRAKLDYARGRLGRDGGAV